MSDAPVNGYPLRPKRESFFAKLKKITSKEPASQQNTQQQQPFVENLPPAPPVEHLPPSEQSIPRQHEPKVLAKSPPAPRPSHLEEEIIPPENRKPKLEWLSEATTRGPKEPIPPSEARDCRTLLRAIYAANLYVANLNYVAPASVKVVKERHRRGHGAVTELRRIVDAWVENKEKFTAAEWQLVCEIYKALPEMGVMPLELGEHI